MLIITKKVISWIGLNLNLEKRFKKAGEKKRRRINPSQKLPGKYSSSGVKGFLRRSGYVGGEAG